MHGSCFRHLALRGYDSSFEVTQLEESMSCKPRVGHGITQLRASAQSSSIAASLPDSLSQLVEAASGII